MHVLLTRPEADAAPMARRIEALGHRVSVAPLLEVEFEPPDAVDLTGVQALIATSRNALRAISGVADIDAVRRLPLYVIGPGTAALARRFGFLDVLEGPGDGNGLASLMVSRLRPKAGLLVHLSGEALAFDLAEALAPLGFDVARHIVYRTVPAADLPEPVKTSLREGTLDTVILMSPRTAEAFLALAAQAGLLRQARSLAYICISEAVAARLAGLAPAAMHVALKPNAEEVLAVLAAKAPKLS